MSSKELFIDIFQKEIKREGADKLLDWLKSTDFFTAPASTNFHSAYKGGLCEHSIKVYYRFIKILTYEYGEKWQEIFSPESVAICSLLHDVCKANFYKEDVADSLPYGHGEKSVYIISGFMRLNREEAMIINWHMGEFDNRVKGGSYSLPDVFYKFPNALLFHTADVHATYLDEERGVK